MLPLFYNLKHKYLFIDFLNHQNSIIDANHLQNSKYLIDIQKLKIVFDIKLLLLILFFLSLHLYLNKI